MLSVADLGGSGGAEASRKTGGGSHQHGLWPCAVVRYATVCPPPFNQPPPFKNPGTITECST